jgi:hypothetical protein
MVLGVELHTELVDEIKLVFEEIDVFARQLDRTVEYAAILAPAAPERMNAIMTKPASAPMLAGISSLPVIVACELRCVSRHFLR